MITRSPGTSTGLGYLVGSGFEGKTKELDNAVLKNAKLLHKTFGKDIEIRFNTNRESGGAFIKDNEYSCKIGIGASLSSSRYHSLTDAEKMELSFEESMKLPKDIILYHAVLDDSLLNRHGKREDIYRYFKTLKGAFKWLHRNRNEDAVNEYLSKLT